MDAMMHAVEGQFFYDHHDTRRRHYSTRTAGAGRETENLHFEPNKTMQFEMPANCS
jgi:hypothetical protein